MSTLSCISMVFNLQIPVIPCARGFGELGSQIREHVGI